MKSLLKNTTRLLAAAAATVVLNASVLAGDPYAAAPSGYKDGAGGTPVPAPMPVADYTARYYFRVDASYGWSDAKHYTTSFSEASIGYLDSLRLDDGLSDHGRFGIGAGVYLNSFLRADMTFEMRSEAEGRMGDYYSDDRGGGVFWANRTDDYIVTRDSTLLFNGYIDLPVSSRFRPYVGAGIGVGIHRFHRTYSQRVSCEETPAPATDCDPSTGGLVETEGSSLYSVDGREKDWSFALAGALMAGAVMDLTQNWKLDMGYRFLHIDGADFSHRISGTTSAGPVSGVARVVIPDQNIHEFRVGLRYDIQ